MSAEKNKLYDGDILQVLRDYIPDASVDHFAQRRARAQLRRIDTPLKSDYRLSKKESARIRCTASVIGQGPLTACPDFATHGQNHGHAPFWYHCDRHAELLRTTGKAWSDGRADILLGSDAK